MAKAKIFFKNGKMTMEMVGGDADVITCEQQMQELLHPRLLEGADVEETEGETETLYGASAVTA